MPEALDKIQDEVADHAAESRLNGFVALAGVTALTRKRWLFGVACAFAGIGILFGCAGFFHWNLHSDLMAKVLG